MAVDLLMMGLGGRGRLQGNDLNAYIAAGVYSDHECHDLADAIAKLERGQFIMIREGTAAELGGPPPPAVRQVRRAVHVLHR